MKDINVSTAAIANIVKYTGLLHKSILVPSKLNKGIILNKASQLLITKPYSPINLNTGTNDKSPNTAASIILVNGPAALILPFFSMFITPRMKTAPGAAKIKPKNENAIAKSSIKSFDLYSAHAPYLCAT